MYDFSPYSMHPFCFRGFHFNFLSYNTNQSINFSVEYDHPKLMCKGNVMTRDGRETTCDFYFPSKLVVQELSTKHYIVLL